MKYPTTCSIAIYLLIHSISLGQANTTSTGGDATGAGGNIAYSVGQIDYIQTSGSGGTANLGVQQTYSISETNNLNELGELVTVTIGPNPTNDFIIISAKSESILSYYITDLNGKLILDQKLFSETEMIQMTQWSQGIYILHITSNQTLIKQIKLIKY